MTSVRRIDVAERRNRLARRHHLAPDARATDVVDLAGELVGLHASDPATVYLSARARIDGFTVAQLEDELYERCSMVKYLGMRRTLFAVPTDLVALVKAACTDKILANERRKLIAMVEDAAIATDGAAWLATAEQATLDALDALGEANGAQLSRTVPELAGKIRVGEGKKWGGEVNIAGRVYTVLAAEGRVRRGRPGGSWTSSQHRWARSDPPSPSPTQHDATVDLVRRWLRVFGPATTADITWWTGLGVTRIRPALAELGVVPVDLEVDSDGTTEEGWLLPDDLDVDPQVDRWVALLPGLDPASMGWTRRAWYLGPHAEHVIDYSGNIGATVWADGRIVGGWGQRKDGTVTHRLVEPVDRATQRRVDRECAALETWLDGVVVTPRFPAPLDKELRGRPDPN